MLRRKTVFVLGAGASKEFGLPTGPELQLAIGRLLDIRFDDWGQRLVSGDPRVWESICRIEQRDRLKMQKACWRVRDGILLSNSIDNFIDAHRNDPDVGSVGKLAIAQAVAQAERDSSLYVDAQSQRPEMDFSRLGDTWAMKLFRYLQEDIDRTSIDRLFNNCSFVVFNYDRCVEHFLFRAVRALYALSDVDAAAIVSSAKILHAYGTIGLLPWQPRTGLPSFDFGTTNAQLDVMSRGISTYTQPNTDGSVREGIQTVVTEAKHIVFLGFSYQPQNMQLLAPNGSFGASIMGTALGFSDYDTKSIAYEIGRKFRSSASKKSPAKIELDRDKTCAQFLAAVSRSFR